MPSFYCASLDNTSTSIILTGDEFHHLAHVLRHKTGDEVKINSGKGWFGKGAISIINKTQAIIDITEVDYHNQDMHYAIAFSLLRSKHDEILVEKVTELGVADLFPFTSQYSVRTPSHNTISRFQQTALSAIKQCDNPYLPIIHPIQDIPNALETIINEGFKVVITSEQRPDRFIKDLPRQIPYCFIIGPEGGFSCDEFKLFKLYDFEKVSLSSLILRAETAAIAAAAQLNML